MRLVYNYKLINQRLSVQHAGGKSQCELHLHHSADDTDFGFGSVVDLRLVIRIGGLRHQGDGAAGGVKPFDGGIIIPHHHHSHLTVFNLVLAADNENIPVLYPGSIHAVPGDTEGKVLRSPVEIRQGIPLDMLLSIERKACGDPSQNWDAVERLHI